MKMKVLFMKAVSQLMEIMFHQLSLMKICCNLAILCDKEYEDNHSYVSSDYSFSELLFQEKTCEDQNEVPVELHGKRFWIFIMHTS